ncbi:hypothetical protein ACO0K9_20280 [Undibacterium sp. Ji50W]|uniref:hypothetical protein n=1 Tax=Undibacterium sp. Ji50W TaxID=3413041 RepID=UPI003BEF6D83
MHWKISKFKQPVLGGLISFLVGLSPAAIKGEISPFDIAAVLKIFILYFPLGFAIVWIYSLFKRDVG